MYELSAKNDRLTASVVTDFYRDGITSFIIVSSDSDFWGLIESLPKAHFLVMYEYEKCGTAIKSALTQHGIYYCAIDDFCSAATEDMKRAVLFAELEKHLPTLYGENPLELTQKIYEATRVTATKKEMENFISVSLVGILFSRCLGRVRGFLMAIAMHQSMVL